MNIEEIAICNKKCETCRHCGVCQELEDFRDPLVWVNTRGEAVCSYYDKDNASDVAREIFEEIERMCIDTFGNFNHRVFAELKKKYTESEKDDG